MSSPDLSGASDAPPQVPEHVRAALADCTADLLLLIDGRGLVRWCNAALERLLDRRLHALEGRPWAEALGGSGPPAALRHAADTLGRGQAIGSIEFELVDAGQARVWLRAGTHALPGGEWLCVMRDVSEARRAQREARRLSELLSMAQEYGRLGIWEREIPSGAGTWDRHMFALWGVDPARGTPGVAEAMSQVHPDDRSLFDRYQASTRTPGRYLQRYRVLRADGGTRWIQSQWEVKAAPDGRPERAVGVVLDDTEIFELGQSLSATHAQLKLALDLGHIAIWRHDFATDNVHYNSGAQHVLNVAADREDIPVAELRAQVHPDDRERADASIREALASDRPSDLEARFADGQGGWRTLLTRRVVERAADGRPLAFVGVALDVTAQARERERLSEQMRRMEVAAAAAGVGVWSYDLETGAGQWNDTMFALVGRAPSPVAPDRRAFLDEIVYPADRKALRRRRARPGKPVEIQYRVLWPGGELRWLENREHLESLAGRPSMFGVTLDVTERRRTVEALRSAGERAALAALGAGIGTWEKDLVGSEEHWDAQMFRLRGLAPADTPPSREERLALLHPDDRALVLDARPEEWQSAGAAQYEFRVRLPDGGWRWLASRSSPVFDAAGRAIRRVGVNWDITEAKLAEAALRESALAQRESQAKSQFLSRVSHELRTPLNAVLGFTQLLQAEAVLPPPQAARLESVRAAADHLLLMINDLLDLSGMATGSLRLAPVPVALAAAVHEALTMVEPLAARHGVALQAGKIDQAVLADPTRLRQVIVNVLTNGIKYNRIGQGRVSVEAARAGERVVLRVADSGRGLDADQLAHLFEPFNRLGADSDGIEGSDIGLVIVKSLVERMDGSVNASSTPGQGTTFTIELPAAPSSAGPAAPAPSRALAQESPPHACAGRVLCIEDNPVNMVLVQELLAQRPGVEALTATTGAEGVRQARLHLPDLVLIDMQLPDFDGFEVLRRLRADARTARLGCIALSANALPDDIERARRAGFDDYWTKPIDFDAFLAGVDAVLADARA